jgi:hypothetical protein
MYDFVSIPGVYIDNRGQSLYPFYMYIFADFRQPTEYRQSAKPFLQSSELGPPHPVKLLAGEGVGSPNSDKGTDTVVL